MKLTLPQQDIYFEQLLSTNDPIYNIGAKIEINGIVNIEIFKKAYIELINQNDAYRSILVKNEEDVSLKYLDEHQSELGFIDFSDDKKTIEEANLYMQKEFTKPFDLLDGNLLHVFTLVKVQQELYYLFSVYHHIITDGWGTSLMFQRLVQNYNEISEFGAVTSSYTFSYKDFAEDDSQYQISESFNQDLDYWSQKFKYLPENLFQKLNHKVQINKSSRKELFIKRDTYNQLNDLAISYKCSTFHIILGLLYSYFGRKHENSDFAIGLPVLNRSKSMYKKTVGLFMGISPLRMSLDFEATFQDLIIDIKKQLRQDYRHQRLPLGKLIQKLQLYSQKERLFNITLSYEKQDYATHFKNTKTKVIPLSHQSERVALALYIREFDEQEDVKIDFDYNLNYFDDSSITQVVNHFEKLLNEVLTNSNKKLKELYYLTEKEKQQLLFDFNDTKVDFPKDKTILDLFKEQVAISPEKTVLKDDVKSYSYIELDKLSNQIANYIIAKCGQEDKSPIAVLLDRSANMIAVLLGILKTGKSYIPLDPTFPKERLSFIVANSQTKIIINENDYEISGVEQVKTISLKNILDEIDGFQPTELKIVTSLDTAYIIYTSGSTGNPKGVEIGHKSLLNFLTSIQNKPGINSNDTLFSVTTYSFDISILEFFLPLISGACLYVASQETLSDPNLVIERLQEIKPTIIQATPSFYQMLFHADWQGDMCLKLLCGGDLLSESLAKKLISHSSEVWNMYGPTETTIWSSVKKIEKASDASNIGKPINNTQLYILDEFLNPKPIGTSGAIYIAGDGLAKGYYKNDILTKEKFIQNPFDSNSLCYETGDVGKWNSEGEIEFLGRNDNQVKIRGYRIELGDIESQLNQIEQIKDSVVIAKKGEQQEAFLVAYVLKNQEFIDLDEIVNQLKKTLPYYMIPNAIIPLEEFPLTPNQKVDRKWLSHREIQYDRNEVNFKEPVSDLEKILSQYWGEVLKTKEAISIADNFFALGGHSLNAVKLIGLIFRNLFLEITLKTIFDYPTIESLAVYLQQLKPSQLNLIPLSEIKELYHLTPTQYTIWLASQQTRGSIAYNMLASYTIEGNIDITRINKSINQIIEKYEILRTNFVEINGIPYQKINTPNDVKFEIGVHKLKDDNIEEVINKLITIEFDLEKEILIRVQLIQLGIDKNLLFFSTHHIIMDGLSLEIFIKEFIQNYNENDSGFARETILKLQFKDYSEWLNKTIAENQSKNELFWKNYLQNYIPKDTFDKDFSIQNNKKNGAKLLFELTEEVTLQLKQLATEKQVTFYTLLVTSINVLIYKLSDHSDICIGMVNSGRNAVELNDQIGIFVNTIVLRTQIQSEQTFVNLLETVNINILEINNYLDIPFDRLPGTLFDVMLVYQNPEFNFENDIELSELKLTPYPIENKFSRMPMVFNLFESDHQLKGIIEYNSDLFEGDSIQIIVEKYSKFLSEIAANPLINIGEIENRLVQEMNTELDFDFNF
ncbi:amino acid adenylation domain-containing protein [Flavobacterium resistens]|uniref:Amino acid adenylation domain-containing protein n=1 Tax=Flavobacterium resistens TaxID=443612 RepID=A0A521FBH2_9FLAO|nr:non-ribosomal peptide synthetase [Flavobacterium resistens]MRX70059.1 amino acid adenylation domain-containing protein [Flavobacterium resistens]SMO92890.1 amino acid adenylation domain-containing protein [Flavobacterium resistens]